MTKQNGFNPIDLALVAVFAAILAVLSLAPAVTLPVGVPITLQTLGVVLCGLVLGPWRGTAAVLLWLVVGFIGLPVFSGGKAGIGVLAGKTGGYLIGFIFTALIAGLLVKVFWNRRPQAVWYYLAGVVGLLAAHLGGIAGLVLNFHLPHDKMIIADAAFWPGDLLKNVVAVAIAVAVHKAFPALFHGRTTLRDPEPTTAR